MWFGTSGGLTKLENGTWRNYTVHDGLPANNVTSLLRDATGILWIGTTSGLAFLSAGHISAAGAQREQFREPILGLADDPTRMLMDSHFQSRTADPAGGPHAGPRTRHGYP